MYQIIVNPGARSGSGKRTWERIQQILDKKKIPYDVHITTSRQDASEYSCALYNEYLEKKEPLHLVVLGGDGTMNAIIQGLPSLDNVALSTIPVGSSNDLARALGISFTPDEAIEHLTSKPTTLYMDYGMVHMENTLAPEAPGIPDKPFLVSSGLGYDAAVCVGANTSGFKRMLNKVGLGKLTYLFVSIKKIFSTTYCDADLYLDDSETPIHIERMLFVAAMNNKYEGGGFMFAPDASNYDGILNLCSVSGMSRFRVLLTLPHGLKGDHFRFEGVNEYKAHSYTLKTAEPLYIHTDGETFNKVDLIRVSCHKESVRIIY